MIYSSGQFMINAKPGIPQVMFISTYLGLAENKRKADCTRLIEVLQGQRGHEKEVKLEIVVHL